MLVSTHDVPSLRTYALAARRAAKRTPGVAGLGGCACAWLSGEVPGITVRQDEHGRLIVDVEVIAEMNRQLDIVGRAVQDAIAAEFSNLPGLRPVAVDIHFTGIRFHKRGLPKRKEYTR